MGLGLFVMYLFFTGKDTLIRYVFIGIGIDAFVNGFAGIKSVKRLFYVTINNELIEWLAYEPFTGKEKFSWTDLRWIKLEKDGSVTCNSKKKGTRNLRLQEFSGQDNSQILKLLEKIATEKGIPLINF